MNKCNRFNCKKYKVKCFNFCIRHLIMINKIKKSKSNKFYGYSQKFINVIDNIIFRQNENIACFRYEEIDLQNNHTYLFSQHLKDCNAVLERIDNKAVILKAIEDIHQNDRIICFFDTEENVN